jgi:(E)-4-hydroxy-3-methylbut-2-enyl-diphosphate synthase
MSKNIPKKTRKVMVGDIAVGGGSAISIQSMTNTDTHDAAATFAQARALYDAGADIVRLAVPDINAVKSMADVIHTLKSEGIKLPIVADIHFDYKIAIAAIEAGADKIRINPGNVGSLEKVDSIIECAKQYHVPIRIGVNVGSLEKDIAEEYGHGANALALSGIKILEHFEKQGFYDTIVSVKSSDVLVNIEASRLISSQTDAPLHIGVTEAGFGSRGLAKSAIGIGSLLADGIGDTIRVSLTGDPVQEVYAAKDILASLGMLPGAVNVISCPTCGRCKVDLAGIAERVAAVVQRIEGQGHGSWDFAQDDGRVHSDASAFTVAVMGCGVNGPGEASHADIGLACGDGKGLIFRKGEVIMSLPIDESVDYLLKLLEGELHD